MSRCNLQCIGASSNRLSCGLYDLLVSEADSMIDEGVTNRYVPALLLHQVGVSLIVAAR
jgi:hypothetical protein